MRKIAVFILLGLCATGSAFGMTVDGKLGDWGVTAGDATHPYTVDGNNWTPSPGIAYWAEDWTVSGNSGYVGPGYGGQNFDVEAAYLTVSNDKLYGAFVSGFSRAGEFGWGGVTSGPPPYTTGDLFFALNPGTTPSWDFAIAMSNHDGFTMGEAYIPVTPGTTWYTTPDDFPESVPAQLLGTAAFTELPGVQYAYVGTDTPGSASTDASTYDPADHNIVEVSIDGTDLHNAFPNMPNSGTVLMHYTESCGNDAFDLTGQYILPEPCTAVLALGAVLAGAFARRRRKGARSSGTDAA